MFFTYVIASIKQKYVYIGHTSNIEKRIAEHNIGKTKSNSPYKPFRLIYIEDFKTRQEAINNEIDLKKSFKREYFRKLAYNNKPGEVPKWLKGRVC